MHTLHTDVPLARRKRLHHVINEDGTLLYSSAKVGECLTWLYGEGESAFWLQAGDDDDSTIYECSIKTLPWESTPLSEVAGS